MKKWFFLSVVIMGVAALWLWARQQRFTPVWNQPKTATVQRGNLRVPVLAAGVIEPNQKIEIKSKASGEIIEIPVAAGDFVKAGDILVKLERDEEERNRDRALSDLNLAKALLDAAKLDVSNAQQALLTSEARLEILKAEFPVVEMDYQKSVEEKDRLGAHSPMDIARKKAAYETNLANQKAGEAAIEQAKLTIDKARTLVTQQTENVAKAQKLNEDAQERLDDTTIRASTDALVTEVKVRVGERIQGAQTTFMGGTALMFLADISKIKVIAKVDEAEYGRVVAVAPPDALPELSYRRTLEQQQAEAADLKERTGKVKITVDTFRDKEFEGVIERVEPQGKQNLGSSVVQFDVHVVVTSAEREMLPLGAQAQVEFTVDSVKNALIVAADAIKSHENQHGVWLKTTPQNGERYAKLFVPCQVGISDGENTEIIRTLNGESIKEGAEVYTRLPPEPKDDEA